MTEDTPQPSKARPEVAEVRGSPPGAAARPTEPGADRVDQLGTIVDRGLDLLEGGLTLGIKLANRLGSALQVQLGDAVDPVSPYQDPRGAPYPGERAAQPFYPPYPSPGAAQPVYPPYEVSRPAAPEPPPDIGYVVNRAPLSPGSPVAVSFTINNDSPTSDRTLTLRVEGFVGQVHGARIGAQGFSIEPTSKTIAPMDFDKFTLVGAIPPDTVGDAYGGWVVVEGEDELRIPVRLFVGGPPVQGAPAA